MSVHPRGKAWVVSWRDEQGRQHNRYFGPKAYGDSQAAKTAAQEFDLAQKLSAPSPEDTPTLIDLVTMWVTAQQLHARTISAVAKIMREPAAGFAHKPADSLTRRDLEEMRVAMANSGNGPNTINKAQAYISAALAWGMERELIHAHPWAGLKRLRTRRTPIEATLDDFRRVLAVAPEWLQWLLAVAYAAALRPGEVEVLSLRWTAMDWHRGSLTVVQGKSRIPKTVLLAAGFLAEARARHQHDAAHGWQWMVHRGDGRRVKSYRRAWLRALYDAGLAERYTYANGQVTFKPSKRIRPYDLRHCVATHLLDAGQSLPVVAARLGHADPSITAAVYSHALDGRGRDAAEALPVLHTSVTHITHSED